MGELKIYEVKEEDWDNVNARRCVTCDHFAWDTETGSNYCDVDKHYISYMDYDVCWCRRWKRDRKWDGVEDDGNGK